MYAQHRRHTQTWLPESTLIFPSPNAELLSDDAESESEDSFTLLEGDSSLSLDSGLWTSATAESETSPSPPSPQSVHPSRSSPPSPAPKVQPRIFLFSLLCHLFADESTRHLLEPCPGSEPVASSLFPGPALALPVEAAPEENRGPRRLRAQTSPYRSLRDGLGTMADSEVTFQTL